MISDPKEGYNSISGRCWMRSSGSGVFFQTIGHKLTVMVQAVLFLTLNPGLAIMNSDLPSVRR